LKILSLIFPSGFLLDKLGIYYWDAQDVSNLGGKETAAVTIGKFSSPKNFFQNPPMRLGQAMAAIDGNGHYRCLVGV